MFQNNISQSEQAMIMTATTPAPSNVNRRSRSNSVSSPAVESVVDAHASRLLRIYSPPEACIDPALGPYVTSILRIGMGQDTSLELDEIEEVDSLLELLEEHCVMDRESAKNTLSIIYMSVRTGVVEDIFGPRRPVMRRTRGMSAGNEEDAIRLLGQMLRESDLTTGANFDNNVPKNTSATDIEANDSLSSNSDVVCAFDADDLLNDIGIPEKSEPNDDDAKCASNTKDTLLFPTTPMKPTTLIPADLLGVLDDPSTPAPNANHVDPKPNKVDPADMETPKVQNKDKNKPGSVIVCNPCTQPPSPPHPKPSDTSHSKESLAQDLAATLFRPTRSRSNSILSDRSPKFKTMQASSTLSSSPGQFTLNISNNQQQLLESTVQILLSLNLSLSESAAREAVQVTDNDVNVAQYILEKAMSAPPVCRHMLNNTCYRSDCQFSHDVKGHTCLFWLKGRCGKGDSCRFLHGFSEHLLEGMIGSKKKTDKTRSLNIPIKTTNLVQHNMSYSPKPFSFMSSSLDSTFSAEEAFGGGAFSLPIAQSSIPPTPISTPIQPSMLTAVIQNRPNRFETKTCDDAATTHSNSSVSPKAQVFTTREENFSSSQEKERPPLQNPNMRPRAFSFAKIASKGYNKESSFVPTKEQSGIGSVLSPNPTTPVNLSNSKAIKYAKIPQDLWNSHHNRNVSFFHISDPMERYHRVTSSFHHRSDVIDLQFQSIKTFPIVLSRILPDKLNQKSEIWIITGSSHHMYRNSHQKSGGVLETAVIRWLSGKGYNYLRGKDKNGYGGAVLVKERR